MNLRYAPTPVEARSDSRSEISTQLSGRWLILARVLWVTLVALILAAFVIIFPKYIDLEVAQAHQRLSFSIGSYAFYTITLTSASMLMCLAVAVVIFWRKSNDWRALLVALMLVLIGTTVVTNAVQEPHSAWEIPALILNTLAFGVLFLVFSLFPDGRFVPHWMGWLTVVWIVWGIVFLIFHSIPSSIHALVWLCALICLVVAQFYRFRYVSSPMQRQQTKWVVFGVSMAIMVVIVVAVPQLLLPSLLQPSLLYQFAKTLGYTLALLIGSLSFGIAILHSRLWDIDVLINRTLVYGTFTALLALLYVGLVFAVQFLLHGIVTQTSTPAIIASTLVIAALFEPLRKSLQALIDRRFYRRKYNAAKIIEAFSVSLREEVDLTQLSEHLLAVVNETMQATSASLWLSQPEPQAETSRVPAARASPAGQMESSPGVIAPDDPLVVYLLSAASAVEIEQLHLDSPALRALQATGVKLAVPVINQGELVGLLKLGPRRSEQDYSSDDRGLLDRLAIHAAPAIRVAQLVREREHLLREQQTQARERERFEQELDIARQIQHAFLPKDLPELAGWQVNAYYQPARAVGGDFYDFLLFEDSRVGIVIGDVTDKGIPAALLMTTTRTILRSVAQRETSPGKILEQTNALLCPEMPPNMFVTCLYAILDPTSGRLRYANAGHDQPYQRQRDRVGELWATGMPLGLMSGMTYEEKETILAEGDSLLLYSDGLVEAHNPEQVMFGFPRLVALLEEQRDHPALIDVLLHHLAAFTGPNWEQEDDLTLVTLQHSPGSSPHEASLLA